MITRYILIWSVCLALLASSAFADTTSILPAPKEIKAHAGETPVVFKVKADESFKAQAEALIEALQALTGKPSTLTTGARAAGDGDGIALIKQDGMGDEGYSVDTRKGIVLKASTTAGISHATATVLQIAEKNKDGVWQVPRLAMKDKPDFAFRGFLADLGRNPHSPETMRRLVDMMWLAKANYLHIHMTDDQLFSWPSKAYPKLMHPKAGWTIEDWQDLEAYSQARGVTIIPEFEMPAHSGVLRRTYPEVFGKTPAELATLDSSYKGLTTILREMMDVFQATPYIHIGADEAYGVDQEAQRKFINRINAYVRSQGRTTVVWEGPKPGNKAKGETVVDTNIIQMNWRSNEYTPADMIRDGYTIINATWDPLYLVDHYPRNMFTAVSSERFYNFDIKFFKHVNPNFPTYKSPRTIDSTKGLIGYLLPCWENREQNLFPLARQRLNAANARVWNSKGERSFESFLERDAKLETLLETIRPWKGEDPTGGWADRTEPATPGNLAHGKEVFVSRDGSQPHFGPQRLTNGATDKFDHFLGYSTIPEPMRIGVDLGDKKTVGRIEVYEFAHAKSWEKYKIEVSANGKKWAMIGQTEKGSRGEGNKVTFTFEPREVKYIRITTDGCQALLWSSFSRLNEIMAFEK